MKTNNSAFFRGRGLAWVALLVLALVGAAIVIAPVWIVQPFKAQSERGLALSYELRRWSPLLTVGASVSALILIVWLWGGARRWWRKAALIVILLPLLASTWFARQNHFEWMFNPLAKASYARPNDAAFLNDADIVLAVESNGEATAYPVRFMGYHHVVQDVVGGTPIAVTY